MTLANADIPLAIIATTLAVTSFSTEVWRLWRDRPRLTFYVKQATFREGPNGEPLKMLRVLVCNVGYRPIVLTRFMALGENSMASMGLDDEPAAMFGVEDRRFPSLLSPGESLQIHPATIAAIERNATKPEDEQAFFDPWKYFVIVDSFGRLHPLDADPIRFNLGFEERIERPKGYRKLLASFDRWQFLWRAKRRVREVQ